jgi:hypothetical protein
MNMYLISNLLYHKQCFIPNFIPAECQWLTPIILVTQEAEIRRTEVRSQPGQIVCETLSQKSPSWKRAGQQAQVVDPEFKTPYRKKKFHCLGPCTVVHTYNPRRQRWVKDPIWKTKWSEKGWGSGSVVAQLKCKALSSNPSTAKKKKWPWVFLTLVLSQINLLSSTKTMLGF